MRFDFDANTLEIRTDLSTLALDEAFENEAREIRLNGHLKGIQGQLR
jgi:hypothetical protein